MRTIPSPGTFIFTIFLLLILFALVGSAGCLGDEQPQIQATQTEQPMKAEYAPGEIPLLYAEAENTARAGFDAIARIPQEERTFENTFLAFDTIITDYTDAVYPMQLMGYVHPDATVRIYEELHQELRGIPAIEGTQKPASFLHLMGGYDAGYYSYLWSKVYAMNIVERFKEDGMTNRTTGMAYRKTVLERGNMADGMVLLTNFLGEEPGIEPMYRFLGINK